MLGIIKKPQQYKYYRTCAKCVYDCKIFNNVRMCAFKRDGLIIKPEEMYVSRDCVHFEGELTTDAYKEAKSIPNPGERKNIMYLCPKCHKEIINFLTCVRMDNRETTLGHCYHCGSDFELPDLIKKTPDTTFSPALDLTTESSTESKTSDAVQQKEPVCYAGLIERVNHIRDLLSPQEFTGFCIGNVLQRISMWREDGGINELREAAAYLDMAIENEEKSSKDSNG